MIFYFLISTVVLTSIFGIIHSQAAREILHLQSFFGWCVKTTKYYIPFLSTDEIINHEIQIIEINDSDPTDETNLMKTQSSQSIEEIDSLRIEDADSIGSSDGSYKTASDRYNRHEDILESISASLKRISSTANSIKLNGNELYNLLLKEMILHHNLTSHPNETKSAGVQGANNEAIIEVKEVEMQAEKEEEKPKMYFGQSPLEYVSHQK